MRQPILLILCACVGVLAATASAFDPPHLAPWTPTLETVKSAQEANEVGAWRIQNLSRAFISLRVITKMQMREEEGKPVWVLQAIGPTTVNWRRVDGKTGRQSSIDALKMTTREVDWANQIDFFYRQKPWIFDAWNAVVEKVDGAKPFQAEVIIPDNSKDLGFEYYFRIDALQNDKLIRCTVDPDFNIVSIEDFPEPETAEEAAKENP